MSRFLWFTVCNQCQAATMGQTTMSATFCWRNWNTEWCAWLADVHDVCYVCIM